jgi:hypothetical protein
MQKAFYDFVQDFMLIGYNICKQLAEILYNTLGNCKLQNKKIG